MELLRIIDIRTMFILLPFTALLMAVFYTLGGLLLQARTAYLVF